MSIDQRARRYAIVSGKGGVGKTVITANLAAALARAGHRTLVLDADLGLANLDVMLGVETTATLQDALADSCGIGEVLVHTRAGFDLLPAGSGSLETTLLTTDLASKLQDVLKQLESCYDVMLFDAGAGVGEVVLHFARIADEIVLVVTPEPTSLMDAYATVKILALRFGCRDFRLIVNQVDPDRLEATGLAVARHLQRVATRFLAIEGNAAVRIHHAGSLPSDPAVGRAISQRRLLLETEPSSPVASTIAQLADSFCVPTPAAQ